MSTSTLQEALNQLRAGVERVEQCAGAEPLEVISRTEALRAGAEEALLAAVVLARRSGLSWRQVGEALGISRQAACQRFGKAVDAAPTEDPGGPGPEAPAGHPGGPGPDAPAGPAPSSAARSVSGAQLARLVFDQLAAGDWRGVRSACDARLRGRLDRAGLEQIWAQIIATLGAYRGPGAVTESPQGVFRRVEVDLHFERGELLGRLVQGRRGRLVELAILPPRRGRASGQAQPAR